MFCYPLLSSVFNAHHSRHALRVHFQVDPHDVVVRREVKTIMNCMTLFIGVSIHKIKCKKKKSKEDISMDILKDPSPL